MTEYYKTQDGDLLTLVGETQAGMSSFVTEDGIGLHLDKATLEKVEDVQEAGPKDVEPSPLLLSILSTKRAHGSSGDTNFRVWLHAEITKLGFKPEVGPEGSLIVTTNKKSTTLFSCHIDTVHTVQESNGTKQKLSYDPMFGHLFLSEKNQTCLGGDDGCGVYIMLRMLEKKVKGHYIFHVGEEKGGIGSRAMLDKRRLYLDGFDRCIAFDRAVRFDNSPEVVATQGGAACASVEFATQLAGMLNTFEWDEPWVVSHGGVFTDNKNYRGVIPENVNLGCFYSKQHTSDEVVDVWGLEKLVDACLKLKWEDLKAIRKPIDEPTSKWGGYAGWSSRDELTWNGARMGQNGVSGGSKLPVAPSTFQKPAPHRRTTLDDVLTYDFTELQDFIDTDDEVLSVLTQLLVERDAFEAQIATYKRLLGV